MHFLSLSPFLGPSSGTWDNELPDSQSLAVRAPWNNIQESQGRPCGFPRHPALENTILYK